MTFRWRRLLTLVAAAAACTTLAVGIVPLRALRSLDEIESWVARSYQIQKELDDILAVLREAELQQRDFLMTHDASYSTAFENTTKQVVEEVADVRRLVSDDSERLRELESLNDLIQTRIVWLKNQLNSAAPAPVETYSDRTTRLGGIELAIKSLVIAEGKKLEQRQQQVKEHLWRNILSTGAVAAASFVMMGLLLSLLFVDGKKRERAEKELQLAKDAADQANKSKSTFLAHMSHEIRTPLGAILGFAEALKDHELPGDDRQAFLDTIGRNGRLLSQLVDDILDLSKVEAGRLEVELKPASPLLLLHEVTQLFEQKAREKNLKLTTNVESDVPEFIMTDAVRFRQILINIIGNAIKFTTAGSISLGMRWVAHLEQLIVTVTDTGCGLSPTQIRRLFRPFGQADRSTASHYGGTGLGLTLSRQLARALGGDLVLAASEPGKGSTFVITVQARAADKAGAPSGHRVEKAVKLPERGLSLAGVKILLADDAEDNRTLVRHILMKEGASVDTASQGAEAVIKASAKLYDVILMDIQMPVLDGYGATGELRRLGYKGPILALTAHAMKEEEERCRAAGCDDHLAKPVDRSRLVQVVAHYAHAFGQSRSGRLLRAPKRPTGDVILPAPSAFPISEQPTTV